jgi:dTDP-glucose 4,6-dehydratase
LVTYNHLIIISKELPINDPLQRQPEISKAKAILNWEPKMNSADGLKITYEYFKSLTEEELTKVEHKNFKDYVK